MIKDMQQKEIMRLIRMAAAGYSEYEDQLGDPEGQELEVLLEFVRLIRSATEKELKKELGLIEERLS